MIEIHAGIAKLSELDYLLESPDDRAGALGFGEKVRHPETLIKFNQRLDLASGTEMLKPLAVPLTGAPTLSVDLSAPR